MNKMMTLFLGVSALLGCNEPTSPAAGDAGTSAADSSSASPTTAGTTAATTSGAATAGDPGGDTSAATESGTSTGPDVVPRGEVRFVALGDAGEGNEAQIQVGQTIATVCEERGCDFALYLGDNFYDTGVGSNMDDQFQSKFEVPYEPVDMPFHITLGNHDYGVLGNEWAKEAYYVAYTEVSDKWSLPALYYSFQEQHVHFVSLNTPHLFWNHEVDEQRAWVQADVAGRSGWIIMFGHHMYISNGEHGNAGNYEGFGNLTGGPIKPFMEEVVCGKAQVYICGHDHSRQWLEPTCGTEFIISGAGSKTTDLEHRDDNPTFYEEDQSEGFLWVEIIDDTFTGVFYDRMGNAQFEKTITL